MNNLKNLDVDIPLSVFTCITGVSGSGKSSLVDEILYKKIASKLRDKRIVPGEHDEMRGIELIKDIRYISQSPIGRTSRSNPVTYLKVYDKIRSLFANTEEAKSLGYDRSYFSFNVKGGRCENCLGEGSIHTALQYASDVKSVCPLCNGKRYKEDILKIKYRGKNIAEVLELSVEDGIEFFKDIKLIHSKLQVISKLGLSYLKLGQASTSLSGGEAQRLKLGKELGKIKKETGNLYILDEPTTGLHLSDIENLLLSINELVDRGNSVVVIEHNMDVIKTADYVIDIGPDAGSGGGEVVAYGTPEEVSRCKISHTGNYLKKYL